MDTQEVKRRRCPNGHPGSKEKKVSKWTPRKWEGSKEKKVSKWTPGK